MEYDDYLFIVAKFHSSYHSLEVCQPENVIGHWRHNFANSIFCLRALKKSRRTFSRRNISGMKYSNGSKYRWHLNIMWRMIACIKIYGRHYDTDFQYLIHQKYYFIYYSTLKTKKIICPHQAQYYACLWQMGLIRLRSKIKVTPYHLQWHLLFSFSQNTSELAHCHTGAERTKHTRWQLDALKMHLPIFK